MKPGDVVVVRGHALGRVTSLGSIVRVVPLEGDDDGAWQVPAADAEATLRLPVTTERAHAAVAALRGASTDDERDVGDRAIAYRRAVKSGELADQIRELGAIYRRRDHEYPERQHVTALERAVYSELAFVLGLSRRRLKAELRSAILGEQPPSSLLLPDRAAELAAAHQPVRANYEAQGAFAIDTKLAIGELAAELVIAAKPGIWFAYTHGDMDDDDHHLLAVHRDHVDDDVEPTKRGKVTAEAASVSLCDVAQLEDSEFVQATQSEGSGVHGTHCFVWHIGGDCVFTVSAASVARRVVYVRIDF